MGDFAIRVEHNHSGNCFARAYECDDCRRGEFCDVCHTHCEPRGDCSECAPCLACEEDDDV